MQTSSFPLILKPHDSLRCVGTRLQFDQLIKMTPYFFQDPVAWGFQQQVLLPHPLLLPLSLVSTGGTAPPTTGDPPQVDSLYAISYLYICNSQPIFQAHISKNCFISQSSILLHSLLINITNSNSTHTVSNQILGRLVKKIYRTHIPSNN